MLSSFLLLLLRNSSFLFFMCKPVLHTAADLRKPSPHTTVVYLNLLQLRSKKSDYQSQQQQYHLHQQRQISFSSLLQDLTTLCDVFDSHELFLLRHDDRIQGTTLILRFLLLQLVVLVVVVVVVVVLFRCFFVGRIRCNSQLVCALSLQVTCVFKAPLTTTTSLPPQELLSLVESSWLV
jgi:hypothetical protein